MYLISQLYLWLPVKKSQHLTHYLTIGEAGLTTVHYIIQRTYHKIVGVLNIYILSLLSHFVNKCYAHIVLINVQ